MEYLPEFLNNINIPTAVNVFLAAVTGFYVFFTYKLLKESRKANELNKQAFEKQYRLKTYPHLTFNIELRENLYLISQNFSDIPAIELNIHILAFYLNSSLKDEHLNKEPQYEINIAIENTTESGVEIETVRDEIRYAVFPQRKKVTAPLNYHLDPKSVGLLVQFKDISGANFVRTFSFRRENLDENGPIYKLISTNPSTIKEMPEIKMDYVNTEIIREDGGNIKDIFPELLIYRWENSIDYRHLNLIKQYGREDRGDWERL